MNIVEEHRKACIWLEDLCGQNWLMDLACGLQSYLMIIPSLRCPSGAMKLDRWVELMSQFSASSGVCYPVLYKESGEEEEAVEGEKE